MKVVTAMNDQITSALHRRFATKSFDSSKHVSEADLATIKESLRMAPSSYGIQPWKFVWVNDVDKRAELRAAGYGQPQFTDASHLLIVAVKTDLIGAIQEYVDGMAAASGQPASVFADFQQMMNGTAANRDLAWFQKQAYIALGVGLATIANLGIDSCPMEGFDPDAVDGALGLNELGLRSTVALAIGYATEPNPQPKFRFPLDQVMISI
jgi:nitroreductase / dihydropteridine reductase